MPNNGEGSRGGKIIRHTKSGNAVYDSSQRQHPSTAGRVGRAAVGLAAGVGTSASIGHVAGKLASKAADSQNKSFDLKKLAKRGKNAARKAKVAKFSVRHGLVQKFLEEAHSNSRVGAALLGAGLIYSAASSAIEDTELDTTKNKAAAFAVSGLAAAAITRVFENRNLTTTAMAVAHAIKKIRKPIG